MYGQTRRWILLSAAVEGVTGLVLIFAPSFAGRLLLGVPFSEITNGVARLAGVALVALAVAFTPQQSGENVVIAALRAPLVYNLLAAMYLIYWWAAFRIVGPLLWVAVALHLIFAALFARETMVKAR